MSTRSARVLVRTGGDDERPPPAPREGGVDPRFRALVGEAAWGRLPPAVQRRFSKPLARGEAKVYVGEVVETRLSRAGRWLAFLARAIGAPLPLDDGMTGPAVVTVTENGPRGGQTWVRCYAGDGRFPQIICSSKCFAGPTGLEEHVGCGIGMALRASEKDGALVFRSVGYFIAIGGARLALPRQIEPGVVEVEHRDEGEGWFRFSLALRHPRLGVLISQTARFRDA